MFCNEIFHETRCGKSKYYSRNKLIIKLATLKSFIILTFMEEIMSLPPKLPITFSIFITFNFSFFEIAISMNEN